MRAPRPIFMNRRKKSRCQSGFASGSSVKQLYGHQEGAKAGYNPRKPGRPSHSYHSYFLANLRLVLRVDVLPGDEYNVNHATDGLWGLLDHLGPARRPTLLRGDKAWGIEPVMARAEREELAYLFRLRMTANVRRDRKGVPWGKGV